MADLEHDVAGWPRRWAAGHDLLGAQHVADDPGNADLRPGASRLKVAIAQHREIVADTHQLFQPVRDVDDGDAFPLQLLDDSEQDFDLGGRKRRRRLVHDQHLNVFRQCLGDFDDLLLADHQVADQGVRVDVVFESPDQVGGTPPLHRPVDVNAEAHQIAPEKNVFRHRQVRTEVELLKDNSNAVPVGVADR